MSSTQDIVNHVHDQVHSINPFQSRSEYSRRSIITYRVTTTVTYLLLVITSIYYTFSSPHEGQYRRGTIWGINSRNHTPFALSAPIVTVYWIVLYTLQIPYLAALYPQTEQPESHVKHACDLAPHFVTHNLLAFGAVHLWCRSYFGWALLLDILDFFQLTFAYFRYPKTPRTMHCAVVAGPLAMSFVGLYWVGAAAVHSRHFAARVVANVFVWTWVVYGGFYIVVFKDWAVGFALSALSAALGVAQFLTVIVALQWIFAFTIMALLFVASAAVAAPGLVGWEPKRGAIVSEEREREPLLGERAA